MSAFFTCLIFIFSVAIYIANEFFHMHLFQGETAVLVISLLPLLGVIFGIWAKGFFQVIGILGNLAIFSIATLFPLYRLFM